ncbi:MAG TPA: RING finger protein, partial [Rhabdochlamydiaceae bacterium]|nr:RING finger protein [Rhabdochlamydiaceae bacterium]
AYLIREKAVLPPYDQTKDQAPAPAQRVNGPGIPNCGLFFNARPWLQEEVALLLTEIPPGSETPRWLAAMRDLSLIQPAFNARTIRQFQNMPPEEAADQFLLTLGTFCVPLDTFVTVLCRSNNSETARMICNESGLILDPQAPPAIPPAPVKPAAPVRQPPHAARPAAPKGPPADYTGEFFNRHPAYQTEIVGILADTPPGGNSPAWIAAAERLSKKYPAITDAVIRKFKRMPTSDQAAEALLSLAGVLRVPLKDFVEALSNSGNAEAAQLICHYAGLPHDMSWIDQPAADCGASAKPAAPLPPLSPAAANPAAPKSDLHKIVDQQQDIFKTIVSKPAAPVAAPAPAADSIKKDKNECPMCLEEPGGTLWTEGNRKWVLLNCNKDSGHACCSVCVQKLLANKEGCPICRGPITNVITIHFG